MTVEALTTETTPDATSTIEVTSLPEAEVITAIRTGVFRTYVKAPTPENPAPDTLEIMANGALSLHVGYRKTDSKNGTAVTAVPLGTGKGGQVLFDQVNAKGDFFLQRGPSDASNEGWSYTGPNFQTASWKATTNC